MSGAHVVPPEVREANRVHLAYWRAVKRWRRATTWCAAESRHPAEPEPYVVSFHLGHGVMATGDPALGVVFARLITEGEA